MRTRLKVLAVGVVLLAASLFVSEAFALLNEPSDLSVALGLVTLGSAFLGVPYVLRFILKKGPTSNV